MIDVWRWCIARDNHSNALRNDLIHPNEYVRGSTLRYLCKLKEPELLEPLMPSVLANLEHRYALQPYCHSLVVHSLTHSLVGLFTRNSHSYVRRNAVLALYSIYKDFEQLCPDAPDLVVSFLANVWITRRHCSIVCNSTQLTPRSHASLLRSRALSQIGRRCCVQAQRLHHAVQLRAAEGARVPQHGHRSSDVVW